MLKSNERAQDSLSVSELVCRARGIIPPKGEVPGHCAVCGRYSPDGFKVILPKTFMAWQYFQERDNLCPTCHHMIREPQYRRSSWLATSTEFVFLKRPAVRTALEDLPQPPWVLYATRNFRKHGWIRTRVNLSNKRFYLTFDEESYLLTRTQLQSLVDRVRQAAAYVGRWWWLKGDLSTHALAQMALDDPDLYDWFQQNWHDALVQHLVYFMLPTKAETESQRDR